MIPRALRPRFSLLRQPNAILRRPNNASPLRQNVPARRTLIAAPRPNDGPLMERRTDRELPDIDTSRRWLKTVPLFLAILAASTLAIFNYQKASSSVVSSTLYSLRTHPKAREVLGDEIYFKHKFPWIWGEMNQLRGRINIHFSVKGAKGSGAMRFRSERRTRMGYFETLEWTLEMEDGKIIELLDSQDSDPFPTGAALSKGEA